MFFVCNSFKQFEQLEGKELAHFCPSSKSNRYEEPFYEKLQYFNLHGVLLKVKTLT